MEDKEIVELVKRRVIFLLDDIGIWIRWNRLHLDMEFLKVK